MDIIKVRLTGTRPLLMHSPLYVNMFDPRTKAHKALGNITNKTTDEAAKTIQQSQWRGALYFDEELGPYIPSDNLEAVIKNGASFDRKGKDIRRYMEVVEQCVPLIYKGPRTIEGLWDDGNFIDVRFANNPSTRGKVTAVRPIFREWQLEFTIAYQAEGLNRDALIKYLTKGGEVEGIGDYRPKFGRFSVEVLS